MSQIPPCATCGVNMSAFAQMVAELERLEKAATPGPWRHGSNINGRRFWPDAICFGEQGHDADRIATVYGLPLNRRLDEIEGCPEYQNAIANAKLIAATRTALPDLLTALRETREALERTSEFLRGERLADALMRGGNVTLGGYLRAVLAKYPMNDSREDV